VVGATGAAIALGRRLTRARGERWYATVYRTIYRLGWLVWQRSAPPADLVALVNGPDRLPPGRALDLGCGSGTDSVYLAEHGWQVTGIDMVPEALDLARQRARAFRVSARFVEGDVTRLREFGVSGPFTLILDFGCLHTLPADQRSAYVANVSAVAAPGATFLLYGFARPPALSPMQAGLTAAEVRERFSDCGWDVVSAEPVQADAIQVGRLRVDRSFELWRYRLVRRTP
jgi:SAM-dependent methyltransferase